MAESRVWVFFYGSYMNPDVLKALNVRPERWEVAKLDGFDIVIQRLANLERSDRHCVYGIVAAVTHTELDVLYAHAKGVLGGMYLPEAVFVETLSGSCKPALCYLALSLEPGPPENDYVERILKPAREYNFPEWYIERLESFRP